MELKRFFSTRAEKIGERKYRFIISDESRDRHESIVKMDGWMLDNYRKNPIVLYQHDAYSNNPDTIVGKSDVSMVEGRLVADLELEPEGDNPIADKLAKKIEFGTMNTASVGFNPIEYSEGKKDAGEDTNTVYFRKQDLLEWSLVHIPSNPNATQDNSYSEFVRMIREDAPVPEKKEEETPEVKLCDEYRSRLLRSRINTL